MSVEDDVRETLAEYERIAQGTGEWDGREPTEFTNDGVTWSPFWTPTAEHPHPVGARSTVHRKGVAHATTDYRVWDEAVPADESWRNVWLAKPTTLFGASTARAAIRAAFREAIGDRREPDDPPTSAGPRDWAAEIAAATTLGQLAGIRTAANLARAVDVPLERKFHERQDALRAEAGMPSPRGMSRDEVARIVDAHLPRRVESRPAPAGESAVIPVPRPPAAGVPQLTNPLGSKPISRKQSQKYNSRRR